MIFKAQKWHSCLHLREGVIKYCCGYLTVLSIFQIKCDNNTRPVSLNDAQALDRNKAFTLYLKNRSKGKVLVTISTFKSALILNMKGF